jgi:hypothetical protein
VVVRDTGQIVQGLRLNENSYHILLIDSRENLRAISMTGVEELHQPKVSSMPSYRDQLSNADVDDLLKYLFSLRETP